MCVHMCVEKIGGCVFDPTLDRHTGRQSVFVDTQSVLVQ